MVRAPELTKNSILENIRNGNFYASTGVFLDDYQVTKKTITVVSQNGDTIKFIGKNGLVLSSVTGSKATYTIKGDENYIRAKITNASSKMAWTQPVKVQ
jgi:hypothetical protein